MNLSVIRTLSNPKFSSGPNAIRNCQIILYVSPHDLSVAEIICVICAVPYIFVIICMLLLR